MPRQTNRTVDVLLELKDAGAVTATGVGQVGGVDRVVDVGAGRIDAIAHIDVSAISVGTADQVYTVWIEGSNSASFASGNVPLGAVNLGHATVNQGSVAETIGRYEVHFTNERDEVTYRYIRVSHTIAGTTPSINYTARLHKH